MPERVLERGGVTAESGTAGLFGKVPVRGDFVRRSLPAAFVDPWDRWLQEGIAGSQDVLGDTWLEVYLTSPVWRFALSAHLVCGQAAAGVLVPSVDQVGRYFPLTIACLLPDDSSPAQARRHASWFEDAQGLALGALEDGPLEPLIAGVEALHWPVADPALPTDDEGLRLGDGDDDLLHDLIERRARPHGLFWTSGSKLVRPTTIVVWQLPSPRRFCALLDGAWTLHGWTDTAS